MKLCNRLAWECFSAGMQCSVTRGGEAGGGQHPSLAVWRQCGGMAESWGPVWPWQLRLPTVMHPAGRGQGLSPAVSTPIGFHGSSLICRICHCRGGLLLGGFKPCCHGSQAPSPPYGYFALSLSVRLSFSIVVPLSFFFYHSISRSDACPLCQSVFVSPLFVYEWELTWEAGYWSWGMVDGRSVVEWGRVLGGKRLLFVWTDAQAHLWTSVSDQRSWWCRTDSWAMSYQPLLQPSSIILSPRPSHSDDGTLNKVN